MKIITNLKVEINIPDQFIEEKLKVINEPNFKEIYTQNLIKELNDCLQDKADDEMSKNIFINGETEVVE